MNTIKTIDTEYLRPSRTIDTVVVSNSVRYKFFYIYNYEGASYRVFERLADLLFFFEDRIEPKIHFITETGLDNYLLKVNLESMVADTISHSGLQNLFDND